MLLSALICWPLSDEVSSPPLSLALPSALHSPYYLHSGPRGPLFYRSNVYKSPREGPSDSIRDCGRSLSRSDAGKRAESLCRHQNQHSGVIDDGNSDDLVDSLYDYSHGSKSVKDQVLNCKTDFIRNYGSLYNSHLESKSSVDSSYYSDDKTKTFHDDPTYTEGNITPYKNIDIIRNYAKEISKQLDPNETFGFDSNETNVPLTFNQKTVTDRSQISSFPSFYLYHPKNCPMHKGAPPRLSPVGAISPPHRTGPPAPGASMCDLFSPLFPRSHTLPALSAPLYYPNLYTPRAPAPPREPLAPKLRSEQSVPPLSLSKRRVQLLYFSWLWSVVCFSKHFCLFFCVSHDVVLCAGQFVLFIDVCVLNCDCMKAHAVVQTIWRRRYLLQSVQILLVNVTVIVLLFVICCYCVVVLCYCVCYCVV